MEKRRPIDIPAGRGLSAGHGGGSYRLKGFEPPRSHSGDSAPALNRAGKTKAPVEKLKSPSREFVDALSPEAKKQLQDKLFPRRIEDYPRAARTRAETEAAEKAASQARSHEFPRYRDPSKFGKQVRKEVAKKHGFDMDMWKRQNLPARGFAKGGKVKSTRDYGK